jgi:hypothetical protein
VWLQTQRQAASPGNCVVGSPHALRPPRQSQRHEEEAEDDARCLAKDRRPSRRAAVVAARHYGNFFAGQFSNAVALGDSLAGHCLSGIGGY